MIKKLDFSISRKDFTFKTVKLRIPKNTKYAFKGQFDSLLVDCPAFDSADDIIYEEQINE